MQETLGYNPFSEVGGGSSLSWEIAGEGDTAEIYVFGESHEHPTNINLVHISKCGISFQ